MFNPLIHNRQSQRLKGHDYNKAGAYFITICTENKHPFFGRIESGELNPTNTAIIAKDIWNQIPNQFPFVELDEFVVMPDHLHGIIIIHETRDPIGNPVGTHGPVGAHGTVGARLIAPLRKTGGFAGAHNPMFHQNLSRIIRWFKGRCSYEIRKTDPSFTWQRNYHEHIIRDTEAYEHICQYIRDNPINL